MVVRMFLCADKGTSLKWDDVHVIDNGEHNSASNEVPTTTTDDLGPWRMFQLWDIYMCIYIYVYILICKVQYGMLLRSLY